MTIVGNKGGKENREKRCARSTQRNIEGGKGDQREGTKTEVAERASKGEGQECERLREKERLIEGKEGN